MSEQYRVTRSRIIRSDVHIEYGSGRFDRRRFLAASAAGASTALLPPAARAQAQGRGLRIVVGYAAGGVTDLVARLVADRLRGVHAGVVIVENRPGAGARLAAEHVKNAEPDGTTLLFTPSSVMTISPHSHRKLAYDPLRDFAAVASVARSDIALSAGSGMPATVRDIPSLVQWLRANPRAASYGSTGVGGMAHLVGVMFARAAGLDLTAVHYKGGAPALQDLLAGQIPISFNPVGEALPHARSGKLRVLATTSAERSRFLPEVPTLVESGYKDIDVTAWLGFFAPARTPAETVARLGQAIGEAVKGEEVAQSLARFANEPSYVGPAEFGKLVRADLERWGPVVKASGFTADD